MRFRGGPMFDRVRAGIGTTHTVVSDTVRAGLANDLQLFAPAMAYSIVISLAPLTLGITLLATQLAANNLIEAERVPATSVTVQEYYAGLAWAGPWASILALALVILGASSLFNQLARALARIWHQPGSPTGLGAYVRQHLLGIALLGVAALALFVTAIVGNVLGGFGGLVADAAATFGVNLEWVESLLKSKLLLEFGFASVLFTVAFASVPKVRPRVLDVVPGSMITAGAYALGQGVLGYYLASSSRFTALGAFGAFLGFLVWAYYTATIVLWGAELCYQIARLHACRRGGAAAAPYVCD